MLDVLSGSGKPPGQACPAGRGTNSPYKITKSEIYG